MNIVITGGAGYIGSVFSENFTDAGYNVTVFDDLSDGHVSAIAPGVAFVHADLANREQLFETVRRFNTDVIIHLAASALVGESMTDPGKYFRNNVANGLNVLDAAVACHVEKVIFSSSCATYGCPTSRRISEKTHQKPVNPYGESKLIFEKFLIWYREIHGLNFVAFRFFNVAGATERYGEHRKVETHLIPNAINAAAGNLSSCALFGLDHATPDGTAIRDYVHVLDLADAHHRALNIPASGFYNLGSGTGHSVKEVINSCEKVSGRRVPLLERPRRPGDPSVLVADTTKATRELGWTPKHSLEDMILSAWHWRRLHPRGYTR